MSGTIQTQDTIDLPLCTGLQGSDMCVQQEGHAEHPVSVTTLSVIMHIGDISDTCKLPR